MLLALDLGGSLGWVLGTPGERLSMGTFDLADTTNLGVWLRSSDEFLRGILPKATALGVEKPDTQGNSYWGIRKNMALLGHVHYWNDVLGLRLGITEISVTTGKNTLAGHGRADKHQMVRAARAKGVDAVTEHEADALGIWWVLAYGRAETKAEKAKREAQERRDAKAAAKAPALL